MGNSFLTRNHSPSAASLDSPPLPSSDAISLNPTSDSSGVACSANAASDSQDLVLASGEFKSLLVFRVISRSSSSPSTLTKVLSIPTPTWNCRIVQLNDDLIAVSECGGGGYYGDRNQPSHVRIFDRSRISSSSPEDDPESSASVVLGGSMSQRGTIKGLASFGPDSDRIVSGDTHLEGTVFDVRTGEELAHFLGVPMDLTTVHCVPVWDPKAAFFAGVGVIQHWDSERSECVCRFRGSLTGRTWDLSECSMKGHLVSCGSNSQMVFWDWRNGDCTRSVGLHDCAYSLKCVEEENLIAVGLKKGVVEFWDLRRLDTHLSALVTAQGSSTGRLAWLGGRSFAGAVGRNLSMLSFGGNPPSAVSLPGWGHDCCLLKAKKEDSHATFRARMAFINEKVHCWSVNVALQDENHLRMFKSFLLL